MNALVKLKDFDRAAAPLTAPSKATVILLFPPEPTLQEKQLAAQQKMLQEAQARNTSSAPTGDMTTYKPYAYSKPHQKQAGEQSDRNPLSAAAMAFVAHIPL